MCSRQITITHIDGKTDVVSDAPNADTVYCIRKYLREECMQDDGRVKVWCVCDSTFALLTELMRVLYIAGCVDIRHESRPATDAEREGKDPWCSWYYAATGFLPAESEDGRKGE